jgi:hypothetical protein
MAKPFTQLLDSGMETRLLTDASGGPVRFAGYRHQRHLRCQRSRLHRCPRSTAYPAIRQP